jgi:2-hydroxychromene-2-carboxylate isomerase
VEVIEGVLSELDLEASGLQDRLGDANLKEVLRTATERAIASGVFGVPTFALGDELFWGHDRIDDLVARCEGRISSMREVGLRLAARPRGVVRPPRPE